MGLTSPAVTNASIIGNFQPSSVAPTVESLPLNLPLNFTGVANLQIVNGQFTPANNTQTIFAGLPAPISPNFLLVIVDGQANLTLTSTGATAELKQHPVSRFFYSTCPPSLTDFWVSLVLDGTLASPNPMVQATAVNYTVVYGQATIS